MSHGGGSWILKGTRLTLHAALGGGGVRVLSAEGRSRPHVTDNFFRLDGNLLVTEQVGL